MQVFVKLSHNVLFKIKIKAMLCYLIRMLVHKYLWIFLLNVFCFDYNLIIWHWPNHGEHNVITPNKTDCQSYENKTRFVLMFA